MSSDADVISAKVLLKSNFFSLMIRRGIGWVGLGSGWVIVGLGWVRVLFSLGYPNHMISNGNQ